MMFWIEFVLKKLQVNQLQKMDTNPKKVEMVKLKKLIIASVADILTKMVMFEFPAVKERVFMNHIEM